MSSLVTGCGSTLFADNSEAQQISAKSGPVLAADQKINNPVPDFQSEVKVKISETKMNIGILTILAKEGFALTEEGLNSAGIIVNKDTGPFSIKAVVDFYSELRTLYPLKDKALTDRIAELRTKYPNYFQPIYKRLCWVYYPKFRYCNEDGT